MWKRLNFAEKLEISSKTRTDPSLERHGSSEDGFAPLLVLPGDSNSGSWRRPDQLACSVASFSSKFLNSNYTQGKLWWTGSPVSCLSAQWIENKNYKTSRILSCFRVDLRFMLSIRIT